jgi:hypothetical protein
MSRPEFLLDEKLPRLLVTRSLLSEIETQCFAATRDVIGSDGESEARGFQIAVEDAYGTEMFSSASNIPTSQFPETTSAVRFELSRFGDSEGAGDRSSLVVKFVFRATSGSRVSVRIHAPQARDRAIGLFSRITQLIEPHQRSSHVRSRMFLSHMPVAKFRY